MKNNIQKSMIDITDVELFPENFNACLGNGKHGFECCCDECDYYLLCFPEHDLKNQEENNAEKKSYIQ